MEKNEKYKVKDLKSMISEEVKRQKTIKKLTEEKEIIEKELQGLLNEDYSVGSSNYLYQKPEEQREGKSENIFKTKPGNSISLSFEDVDGIKLRRQKRETEGMVNDDFMWEVIDAKNSVHLKDGDYLKLEGNDNLRVGNSLTFKIFRVIEGQLKPTNITYKTNKLTSWLNNI